VGPRDRPREPADPVRLLRHLPPDVSLRVPVRHGLRRAADPARPAVPFQAARALRALRDALHLRPFLRGAAPHRPLARDRPAAAERLGLDRRVHSCDGVLRLVAVPARPS
jgi:hypothetical protein